MRNKQMDISGGSDHKITPGTGTSTKNESLTGFRILEIISSEPENLVYSRSTRLFLDILDPEIRNALLSKKFYHCSPVAYRHKILDLGLQNPESIITEEEEAFVIRISQKICMEEGYQVNDFINQMILGIHGEKSRGVYISASPLARYYPVPERIRLYFRFISENLDYLDQSEKDFAISAFRKYIRLFSGGTDIWEIGIHAPIILDAFCSGYSDLEEEETAFIAESIIGSTEPNIQITGTIPPQYLSLKVTGEIFDDSINWSGCGRLMGII